MSKAERGIEARSGIRSCDPSAASQVTEIKEGDKSWSGEEEEERTLLLPPPPSSSLPIFLLSLGRKIFSGVPGGRILIGRRGGGGRSVIGRENFKSRPLRRGGTRLEKALGKGERGRLCELHEYIP